MFWDKIIVKDPVQTGTGQSVKFLHDNYNFAISYKVLYHHGIIKAEDLENKIIIFDKNKEIQPYKNPYHSTWLRIAAENIVEIVDNPIDNQIVKKTQRKELGMEELLKKYNLDKINHLDQPEDLDELEDLDRLEDDDSYFLENETLEVKDWSKIISKINFDKIYNSIESYKISQISEEMDGIDKLIEKSIKLTPSKYKNKKHSKKIYYSFNMLFDFADEQLIQFLNGELDTIRISFPKEIKLPKNTQNQPEKIIDFLTQEKLLNYSTKTNVEHFLKNRISIDEFIGHINKNRNNNFARLKDIQKEANKIKNETGVNPLVIAWPFLKGKTMQGTIFHCPIAYTNIEIEESINYFEINRMSNFEINTYPILKNYSELKGFVNKITPEFSTLKECLIEFFKHGIKILSPNSNEFIDYSYIDQKNKNEFDFMVNDFFQLSNEVLLIIKEHDEFINYDLREIKAEYGSFDIPKTTSTLINDENENRNRHYCLDLDNSKVTAIEKSIEKSTVIFGPPGTGKSESITAIITEIIKNSQNSIFVAEKNTAINVVESNLGKVHFSDFMINLNNNSKMQFQEKFNNQIELIFKPHDFNVSSDALIPKNFAENWLKEIEVNGLFYQKIGSQDIKFVFEIIAWFNEITSNSNTTKWIDVENKINSCQEDELKQNHYNNLVPQIKTKIENKTNLDNIIQKQEAYLINLLENKIKEAKSNIAGLDNLILKLKQASKEKILILVNKITKTLESIEKEQINKKEQNKNIANTLSQNLENSPLVQKYIDVYDSKQMNMIANINDINEFFIYIQNKKPLMLQSKIKKSVVEIKKLMNEIKKHQNKYEANELEISKKASEIIVIKKLQEEMKSFNDFEKLLEDKQEMKKYFELDNDFQIFLELQNSIIKTKINIENITNTKRDLSVFYEDKTKDFMKNLDLNKSNYFDDDFSNLLFQLRRSYKNYHDESIALNDYQREVKLINIESINTNVAWLKQQNLDNFNILKKDVKMREILDFYLLNKTKLNVSKNVKWEKFQKNKQKELNNIVYAIKASWSNTIKNKYNEDEEFKSDLDTLKKYITNKLDKRGVTIHSLFKSEKSLNVLKFIFPCIAMDPETASKILPIRNNIFEYGIFDEASQIRLHKAIPTLHRSKKAIVAGDDKQLGPTDLFSIENEENDQLLFDDESDFNNKTLLNFAKDRYQNFSLLTHYRSKAKDLIEFSNNKFYNNKIETADSPLARYDGKKPIILEEINGKWENQTNPEEAKRVVELAKHYLIEQEKTLGIITFNDKQEQLINQLLVEDEELRPYLRDFNKLFVKPIKNVQGDEKEVVIFSIAYGKREETGKYVKSYGNFSKEKINVAITRSKLRMHVLKSIPSSEISRNNEDYRVFADWLEFIEIKNSEPDNIIEHKNMFRSQFEEDYFNLLHDLLPKNIKPLANYKVGKNEIDVVLYNIENNKFVGAIELDGIKYHSSTEQILKDFDRQTFLESLGWMFVRVSPINFYKNRKKCIIENLSKHGIISELL